MEDGDDNVVVHALWAIAEEFLHQSKISESILCLESITQSKTKFSPDSEVKTRIRLADLFLRYTENIDQAKEHLDKSLLLLPNLTNETEYKLQIIYLLSRVYEIRGQMAQLKQIIKRGTEFEAYPQWYQYFTLQMAKILLEETKYDDALLCLDLGKVCAEKKDDLPAQILFLLSQLQIYLKKNDFESCSNSHTSIERLLTQLSSLNSSGSFSKQYENTLPLLTSGSASSSKNIQQMKNTLQMLQIHHLILFLIYCIKTSNFKEANKKLDELYNIISAISSDYESVFYTWMPLATLYSCTYLIATICNRPIGNMQTATRFATKALKLINAVLSKEQQYDKSLCHVLSSRTQFINSLLCHKFSILENLVYIHLTTCKLQETVELIKEVVCLYEEHSSLFPEGVCVIHILLGLYAHCLGNSDYVIAHFNMALNKVENEDKKSIILIYLALAYLQIQALDKVSTLVHTYNKNMLSNRSIKAGILFIEGLLYYYQRNNNLARDKIKECLGIANGSFSHNQLATMALNALGSVFLSDDLDANLHQTVTVLKSALMLSHRSEDFYSKLHSLNLLIFLYDKRNGDPINQSYILGIKTQKEQELAKAMNSVEKLPDTIRLLTKYLPVQTPTKTTQESSEFKESPDPNNPSRKRIFREVN